MRVLLVNYEWPGVTTNCGGGGAVSQALRVGLENRGHEVRVVTDDADGHYATFPIRTYRDIAHAVEWADVVNGHFSIPSSIPLPRLCRHHDTPLVVSVMGADIYDPTRFRWLRPLTSPVNQYVLRGANHVVAPSQDMADRVRGRFDIEPRTIPYGIDPDAWDWRPRERHDPLRVLTVCRLVERKNLPLARATVAGFTKYVGDAVDWRVVGDGPLRDTVESWPEADARGYVNDLQAEYDWADVFLLPSKHEAFGIVFLEALASGLPVVTTATGGQADIVDDGHVGRFGVGDGALLELALADVAENYDHYQANTQDYVREHFARDTMVDGYETLFQDLT